MVRVFVLVFFSVNFLEWRDYMLHYDDVESKMLLHGGEQ